MKFDIPLESWPPPLPEASKEIARMITEGEISYYSMFKLVNKNIIKY